MYRDFLLKMCNDGEHYDILHQDIESFHLIAIVESYDKAIEWVDEWHKKYEVK